MAESLGVLIVDDHPLTREGLCAYIKRDPGFHVAGEAGSSAEALKIAAETKPDLALLDITLPDGSGLDLLRKLLELLPRIKVMMLSMHAKMEFIAQAFRLGALGYVVKGSPGERILDGLSVVARGDHFLDSAISPEVVTRLILNQDQQSREPTLPQGLTEREAEVLTLLARGKTTKEVAAELFLSPKTVEGHRARIMQKHGLHTPVDLVRFAVRLGLIDLD